MIFQELCKITEEKITLYKIVFQADLDLLSKNLAIWNN